MIFVVHGPEATRTALVTRGLALVSAVWILAAVPAGVATADACAYASTGPDGTEAVAVAGSYGWQESPVCPQPTPPPEPPQPQPPEPTPTPTPTPAPPRPPAPAPKPPPPAPRPPAPKPRPQPPAPPRRVTPPPRPAPAPPPAPAPAPEPPPAPRPSAAPVTYPPYHATARQRPARGGQSPVTYVLLVTVPALVAVAALRPR